MPKSIIKEDSDGGLYLVVNTTAGTTFSNFSLYEIGGQGADSSNNIFGKDNPPQSPEPTSVLYLLVGAAGLDMLRRRAMHTSHNDHAPMRRLDAGVHRAKLMKSAELTHFGPRR